STSPDRFALPTERPQALSGPHLARLVPRVDIHLERTGQHVADAHLAPAEQPVGHDGLPFIRIPAGLLLAPGGLVRHVPPRLAGLVAGDRLGEQLVAVACDPGQVDSRAGDRPEPARARLVTVPVVLVRGP